MLGLLRGRILARPACASALLSRSSSLLSRSVPLEALALNNSKLLDSSEAITSRPRPLLLMLGGMTTFGLLPEQQQPADCAPKKKLKANAAAPAPAAKKPGPVMNPIEVEVEAMFEARPEYDVEAILADRVKGNTVEYQVKWKGCPASHNSWEPVSNLSNLVSTLIKDFHKQKDEANAEHAKAQAEKKAAKAAAAAVAAAGGASSSSDTGDGAPAAAAPAVAPASTPTSRRTSRVYEMFHDPGYCASDPTKFVCKCKEGVHGGGECGTKLCPSGWPTTGMNHLMHNHRRTYQELKGLLDGADPGVPPNLFRVPRAPTLPLCPKVVS